MLVAMAILLELAAGVGLAYLAGWSEVRAALGHLDGIWLIALVGGLLVSFVGYHYAYRGIWCPGVVSRRWTSLFPGQSSRSRAS